MKVALGVFLLLSYVGVGDAGPAEHREKRSLYTRNETAYADQAQQEKGADYWNKVAKNTLDNILKHKPIHKPAKNIIFFLGDGMSIPTVTAARIHKAQFKEGLRGEDYQLVFEKFPNVALSKTYNVDKQVPDSAGTATAYLCGVKANYGTIGVTASVPRFNCTASLNEETHVSSILQWAQEGGKDTGFVTTTRVTHATPAGLYAHVANRDWESDGNQTEEFKACKDIAYQLVHNNASVNAKVIMGGGFKNFYPSSMTDKNGIRQDGKNLIDSWKAKNNESYTKVYVETREELMKLNVSETDYLLGLFNEDHLTYEVDKNDVIKQKEPNIVEMTQKAIEMLQKSDKGFFLLVEGGKIDLAHHVGLAKKALREAVFFDDAIEKAVEMTNEEETLIIVTADHAHVMTMNGYPSRGNDILGVVVNATEKPLAGLDYTTLMYTNGPGFRLPTKENLAVINISNEDPTEDNFHQLATVPKEFETHGGDDVGIFARGPMSHLFRGVVEQNYIAHAMAYASCLRGYDELCTNPPTDSTNNNDNGCNSGITLSPKDPVILLLSFIALFFITRTV